MGVGVVARDGMSCAAGTAVVAAVRRTGWRSPTASPVVCLAGTAARSAVASGGVRGRIGRPGVGCVTGGAELTVAGRMTCGAENPLPMAPLPPPWRALRRVTSCSGMASGDAAARVASGVAPRSAGSAAAVARPRPLVRADADAGGAEPGGAEPGGAEPDGAEPDGAETGGVPGADGVATSSAATALRRSGTTLPGPAALAARIIGTDGTDCADDDDDDDDADDDDDDDDDDDADAPRGADGAEDPVGRGGAAAPSVLRRAAVAVRSWGGAPAGPGGLSVPAMRSAVGVRIGRASSRGPGAAASSEA
jgi:hypothetical protein